MLFAPNEHNYGLSAAEKIALDWGSRPPGRSVWNGKPAGILSASPGGFGGARAPYELRQSVVSLNMFPINRPEVFVLNSAQKFDVAGRLVDEADRKFIREHLVELVRHTRVLRQRTRPSYRGRVGRARVRPVRACHRPGPRRRLPRSSKVLKWVAARPSRWARRSAEDRCFRKAEVGGSNPPVSTYPFLRSRRVSGGTPRRPAQDGPGTAPNDPGVGTDPLGCAPGSAKWGPGSARLPEDWGKDHPLRFPRCSGAQSAQGVPHKMPLTLAQVLSEGRTRETERRGDRLPTSPGRDVEESGIPAGDQRLRLAPGQSVDRVGGRARQVGEGV
jgi:hypothetical protein